MISKFCLFVRRRRPASSLEDPQNVAFGQMALGVERNSLAVAVANWLAEAREVTDVADVSHAVSPPCGLRCQCRA